MDKLKSMFQKDYYSVRIIPMNSNEDEPRVNGEDVLIVKESFFGDEIKNNKNYYFHGRMVKFDEEKPVLVLFQYQNKIISYGRMVKLVRADDVEYVDPRHDNFKYDGFITLSDIFEVEDISNEELNNVLNQNIKFSNIQHNLDIDVDKFQSLLFSKTKI